MDHVLSFLFFEMAVPILITMFVDNEDVKDLRWYSGRKFDDEKKKKRKKGERKKKQKNHFELCECERQRRERKNIINEDFSNKENGNEIIPVHDVVIVVNPHVDRWSSGCRDQLVELPPLCFLLI